MTKPGRGADAKVFAVHVESISNSIIASGCTIEAVIASAFCQSASTRSVFLLAKLGEQTVTRLRYIQESEFGASTKLASHCP